MNDIKNDKCVFCGGEATYTSLEGDRLCDTCAYVLPAGLLDLKKGEKCYMTVEQLKELAETNFKYKPNTPNLDLVRAQINKMTPKKTGLDDVNYVLQKENERLKQERNNWETLAGQYRFKAEILEEENEGLEKEVEDLDEENEELNEENEELDQKVTQLTNELNVANFQKMQLESSVEKLSKSIEFYRKLALDTAKFKLIYNCPAW